MIILANKLYNVFLLPYRLVIVLFKRQNPKIKVDIDKIVIIENGITRLSWNIENVFLVTISGIGIVNLKGEYIFKNNLIPDKIEITAYGNKGFVKKRIQLSKLKFGWNTKISPILIPNKHFFRSFKISITNPIATPSLPKAAFNYKHPKALFNTGDLNNELKQSKDET